MTTTETLVKSILDDAAAEAQRIEAEARSESDQLILVAKGEAVAKLNSAKSVAKIAGENIYANIVSEKKLLLKKCRLNEQRAALDRVYAIAKDKLVQVDDSAYLSWAEKKLESIGNMPVKKIIVGADEARVTQKTVGAYKLEKSSEKFFGGFKAAGDGLMLDFTFPTLLEAMKTDVESETARILFGENDEQ